MNYLGNATTFISQSILGLILYVVLLRFWMQWVRADFRNPLGQFVITVTNPVIIPLRKVIPSIGTIDTATVLLAFVVALFKVFLLVTILGRHADIFSMATFALGDVIRHSIHLFFVAIFIQIIASWINPQGYNPILSLARSIAEPIMAPARRVIPPIGGLDLSPILVIMFLQLTLMLVVAPLQGL